MARLLAALSTAPRYGRTKKRLMKSMDIPGDPTGERMFARDLANLRDLGWDIKHEQVIDEHRYRLHVIDNRIRRSFTAPERAELFRVARRAGLGGLYDDLQPGAKDVAFAPNAKAPAALETARHAVQFRCLLKFVYHGKKRVVHPYDVMPKASRWLLRGEEETKEGPIVKKFYIDEITDLKLGEPGTASPSPPDQSPVINDPVRFPVHPELDVFVSAREVDLEDVRSALGAGCYQVADSADSAGMFAVTVSTTNLDGLLMRLFELGSRVRLVGPAEVRDAARNRLAWALGDKT